MKFSLKLITPKSKIEKDMLLAINRHLSQKLSSRSISKKIESKGRELLSEAFYNSNTVRSLLQGELRGEIGLPSSQDGIVDSILKSIAGTIEVTAGKPKVVASKIRMKIVMNAVPTDLKAFSSLGSYTTEKGTEIPWFEWLTSLGDRVIVREYEVESGHAKSSRTGDKIMVKGKGWRVPPEHAGSQGNNFITKASEEILPELGNFIVSQIRRSL